MKFKRFISVFLLCTCLTGLFLTPAAGALEVPDIQAKAALLADVNTDAVAYAKNIHEKNYPASLTKVMTALLILEKVSGNETLLNQEVTASESAFSDTYYHADGSSAGIKAGEVMTVKQLLQCMLIVSANEACNILAEWDAGSIAAFVDAMNAKAKALGCENTHFVNPSGLHDPDHYTSAWDLYLITREAMTHDDFMTIVNTKSYEIPPTNKTEDERVLHSTNALISNWRLAGYLYSGAQGIKTGSTDAAGQCLVSSAVRGSRTLVSVVLGAQKVEKENGAGYVVESFTETARLFDYGFDNFASRQVLDENELIQEVPVALSKQVSSVAVHPAETTEAMLPKDVKDEDLVRTVKLDNETANAPIAAGDRLGEITVSYNGQDCVTVPLLAVADVSVSRFLLARHNIGLFFSRPSVRIAAIALIVLAVALVLWFRLYGRNRRYGKSNKNYRQHAYRGRRR